MSSASYISWYSLPYLTGYMHQSFSGQLGQCLQDDRDKGEGGIGWKQLKTEFSDLSRCSDVMASESEDRSQAQLQSNRHGQTWRQKYHQRHRCIYKKKIQCSECVTIWYVNNYCVYRCIFWQVTLSGKHFNFIPHDK